RMRAETFELAEDLQLVDRLAVGPGDLPFDGGASTEYDGGLGWVGVRFEVEDQEAMGAPRRGAAPAFIKLPLAASLPEGEVGVGAFDEQIAPPGQAGDLEGAVGAGRHHISPLGKVVTARVGNLQVGVVLLGEVAHLRPRHGFARSLISDLAA